MSDESVKKSRRSKRKAALTAILGATLMLCIGGGATYGLFRAGLIGTGQAQAKADNTPRLVRKGEDDPYAVVDEDEKSGPALPEPVSAGGSPYRTAYFSFGDEFTSNLKGSDALVQLALACSTQRDGRVLIWLRKHELAIRSALLTVLADTPENDAYTTEGKRRLRQRMTGAINRVLTEAEGFGGVDAVYFRNFIIQ